MSKETLININEPEDPTRFYTTDIISLIVNGKRFSVHQSVLATASPVFSAMFSHDVVEREQRTVTIPDVDADVFQAVLQWVYQNHVEEKVLAEMGLGMWIVADKYQMDPLKQLIEQHICPDLMLETVTPSLLLAHLHNITRIKVRCIDYFTENSPALLKRTTEWKQLLAHASSDLFAELYRNLAGKIRETRALVERQEETLKVAGSDLSAEIRWNRVIVGQIVGWFTLSVLSVAVLIFIGWTISSGVSMTVSWVALCGLFILLQTIMCVYIMQK